MLDSITISLFVYVFFSLQCLSKHCQRFCEDAMGIPRGKKQNVVIDTKSSPSCYSLHLTELHPQMEININYSIELSPFLDPFLDHKKLSTFYMSPVVELGSVQHIIFMSKFLHWRPAISPAGSTVIHSQFKNCAEV